MIISKALIKNNIQLKNLLRKIIKEHKLQMKIYLRMQRHSDY